MFAAGRVLAEKDLEDYCKRVKMLTTEMGKGLIGVNNQSSQHIPTPSHQDLIDGTRPLGVEIPK